MITVAGTDIISSLGFGTDENFENVLRGVSGLKLHSNKFDLPEPIMAALIDRESLLDRASKNRDISGFSLIEKAAVMSVESANREAKIDLSSSRTIFLLSTTKGNISHLANGFDNSLFLWHSAKLIAQFFGNRNTPIVVSNACISGAAAQIAAMRELQANNFDYAVAIGADLLSKFIVSGFQSFKALSQEPCRPFDQNRKGLNLGEAVATIIFSRKKILDNGNFGLTAGFINNDATHISAPSRVGEGSFRALSKLMQSTEAERVAFINAHGTATPYNDSMEAEAISRAGLQNVPVNSLKPFFGHTLGAAGIVESIVSIEALRHNIILPTKNFCKADENCKILINKKVEKTDKHFFIKIISGFGGVNAALLFKKNMTK